MKLNQFYCQPCDHKWWQHRNPDPQMRTAGGFLMLAGLVQVVFALFLIITH